MEANEGTKLESLRRELDAMTAIDVAAARGFAAAAGDKLAGLLRLGVYEGPHPLDDVRPGVAFGIQSLEEALSFLERARDHVKQAHERAQAEKLKRSHAEDEARSSLGFSP